MTDSVQSKCATGRTDGFIEIRDECGYLWCEYHPERRVIRRFRKHKRKGVLYTAEIPIDGLIDGSYRVDLQRTALPD